MPLWEHLDELRTRLIRCLVAIVIGVAITYNFSEYIVLFLEKPLLNLLPESEAHLYFTGLTDKFMTYLKVSVLSAIAITYPYLMYEIWRFVAPGLYRDERRFALPFIVVGTFAFLAGLAFAYWVVIPYGYHFLINFGSPSDKPIITLTEYFSLTLKLILVVGIVFELPVAMVLLAKFGILDAKRAAGLRKHAFVASAVISAVLTPSTDAFSMLLVLIPMIFLYELGILGVKTFTH